MPQPIVAIHGRPSGGQRRHGVCPYNRNHIHTLEANNMLPSTADRVRDNTADKVNKQIDMQTEAERRTLCPCPFV